MRQEWYEILPRHEKQVEASLQEGPQGFQDPLKTLGQVD